MEEQLCIIVTIAPEVTLKSFHVRKFIEKKLKENIKVLLKNNSIKIKKIENIGARYAIETNDNKKAFELLKKCFGIYYLAFAQKISYNTLEEISGFAKNYFPFNNGTFAVKGKSYSKEFNSKKLDEECGGAILEKNQALKVNLSKPEHTIFCIVSKKTAYFFLKKIVGAKGMPVGSQGTIALICSGQKSEKLAWLLMQNGCAIKTIGASLPKLNEWASFISIKQVSFDEAKQLFNEKRIMAFFTSETKHEKICDFSEKLGTKVFSPLIIDSYKTPFDE
jgi:tRNA uracil 4-sulfurtransferase